MPVAGEPLVRRILRWLAAAGVARAVLNLHHLPETICQAVSDGADLGLEVRYSWEPRILGSAGGPRRALPLLEHDRFLIVNGDTLSDLDPGAVIREHERSGAQVTLAVVPNTSPARYGGVLIDADGAVTGFVGRGSTRSSWHFVGVQVVDARVFAPLPPDERVESVAWLYPTLLRDQPGSVRAWRGSATFADIGTLADYYDTSIALGGRGRPSAFSGQQCETAPSARLTDSILWDHVIIEADAEVNGCVLADGVRIPSGGRFDGQVVVRADACPPGPADTVIGDLLVTPLRR
jgi:mannose-1-phosphate guanylyltransferase